MPEEKYDKMYLLESLLCLRVPMSPPQRASPGAAGHSGSVGMGGGTPGGAVLHSLTYLCSVLPGPAEEPTAWL